MINIKNFIELQKNKYYAIKYVHSIIFLHQEIVFNKTGFTHLIRKGKHHRSTSEKIRRLNLLDYIVPILENHDVEIEYKFVQNNGNKTHFWGITKIIDNVRIKIIIYKVNDGKLTFLSIMNYTKGK